MKLKPLITLGALTSILHAGGGFVRSIEPVIDIPIQQIQPVKDKDYFAYMAGGMSKVGMTHDGTACDCVDSGALDEEGGMLEIGVGYQYSQNIFVTLAAQRTMLEIVDIDNVYLSLNYEFNVMSRPYIGVLAGYSKLTWNEYPETQNANYDDDLESTGLVYGIQLGIQPHLTEKFSLFAKYQFLKYDHIMHIRPDDIDNETIEHSSGQNLLTGVQYGF
jgi:hypothetical protein